MERPQRSRRANLNGTGVDKRFITGARNPCGVAVNNSYIYWGGDVGDTIGRAKLNSSSVNRTFITTGTGVCGVAVNSSYIYWAHYQRGYIGRAKLNGTGVNSDFIKSIRAPALAIDAEHIYWTNQTVRSGGRISTARG